MEFAPGGDLARVISAGQGLAEAKARWLFQQVLFALEYCHRMGVVSRDIKLENVLLMDSSPTPIVKLADFGLSAEVKSSCSTCCSGCVGTPTYFAPEVLLNKPYDAKKTDVWSCGVFLYAVLTGCCPFKRAEDAVLSEKDRVKVMLQRILRVDYTLPSGLSDGVKDLLGKMLVADPSRRPSIREVMHHPWCNEGLQASSMLAFNDEFVAKSKASPPPLEVIYDVRSLVQEAILNPCAPWSEDGQGAAKHTLPGANGSRSDSIAAAVLAAYGVPAGH